MRRAKLTLVVLFVAALVSASFQAASAGGDSRQMPGTSGGGGWFEYGDKRITFGFYAEVGNKSQSSLVLQGRDLDMTVHAVKIGKVWFTPCKNGEFPSVHVKGEALVDGTDLYRFHFKATDKGLGKLDTVWLKLWPKTHGGDGQDSTTNDTSEGDCSCSELSVEGGIDVCDGGSNIDHLDSGCSGGDGGCSGGSDGGHGMMIRWMAHGLGGGNIWAVMPEEAGDHGDCAPREKRP
jgi:hypothetical protein